MKYFCILLFVITCVFTARGQHYKKLHSKSLVIDSHNDILSTSIERGLPFDSDLTGKTHSDLQRLKQGGVDVQVFSIWCDGLKQNPYDWANREIDTLEAWTARASDKMMFIRSPQDLQSAVNQKKLGAMIGVEGGHMIENDLKKLDALFNRGARYMTLTWNNSTSWATSAQDETNDTLLHQPKGLNDFGRQVVQHMNQLGMMVDLSHVGERTFYDVLSVATKPVLLSHSCAYRLCPVFRNIKDEQIKAVGKNGGVIQVNFFSGFLDSNYFKNFAAFFLRHKAERDSLLSVKKEPSFADDVLEKKYAPEVQQLQAPMSLLLDHIDYIVRLAGTDHVGLGSDFDGINSPPAELYDVTTYPLITRALLARGYHKKDVRKILGGNFLRVFKANSQ